MLKAESLTKVYGDIKAVNQISFQVEKGEILGFLGPNGAGKSTTMKMLTCFISPTSGTAKIEGYDILENPIEVKKRTGYLPESAPSYKEMTVYEFLDFIAEVRGFSNNEKSSRIQDAMEKTYLRNVQHQQIDTLSKGYRQRVCLAQSILHDPPVLILDEPTDGLDPNQKREVRNLIRQMSQKKVIILSTHNLEEVEAVCSRAIIINNGEIVIDGTPGELLKKSDHYNNIEITTTTDLTDDLIEKIKTNEFVSEVTKSTTDEKHKLIIVPNQSENILFELMEVVRSEQITVDDIHVNKGHLDEVFKKLTVSGGKAA